jgi:hypothetical protein
MCITVLATATAAADKLESGPEVGTAVPALTVYDVTGPHMDKEVDYAADRKDKPTVYLFVVAAHWDRPVARFMKKLDAALAKHADAKVIAVWLTDDVEGTKQYLPMAQESLKFEATTLTCYPAEKKTPDGWLLHREAGVTAVVAAKGKVAASLAFRAATEEDVPSVVKAVEKATGKK